LRLTLLYTPAANYYVYQSTQDWGIHDFKYAVYGHKGDWDNAESPWQAKFFNQPLMAFEAPKHDGAMGQSLSMLSINNPKVGVMAFKKMEEGDYYLIRVNELSGKDLRNVVLNASAKIVEAFEVNGQEKKIGGATLSNGALKFDLSHYTIRSFAVKLAPSAVSNTMTQKSVTLPYNSDVMSYDTNRDDCNFNWGMSLPAELVPEIIVSEDVKFVMGSKEDGKNNAVTCRGQEIKLPEGTYNKLYILTAASNDVKADFSIGGKVEQIGIQGSTGFVGQFYNRLMSRDNLSVDVMEKPFSSTDNIAWFANHTHSGYPSKNEAYQYCYLYKFEINVPAGAKSLTLPNNDRIKVLAVTAVSTDAETVKPLQKLYDDFKGNPEFILRAVK